jgi:hypothetical protein
LHFDLDFAFSFFGWNLRNRTVVLRDTELEVDGAKLYHIYFVNFLEFRRSITWVNHF